MNVHRRPAAALVVLALMFAINLQAQAQAHKQLPADPLVVIKFNNPEAISKKVADLAKRLGLDKFNPEAAADPLAMLKKELNLKEGFNAAGEVVFGLYDAPKAAANAPDDNGDPRLVALLPISNYELFLKNFQNVRSEGNLSTFTLPEDDDVMYAANWGQYAAFTDKRGSDLIKAKGTGVDVIGLAAKQMTSQDAVVFANAKLLGAKVLPQFKEQRGAWIAELEQSLNAENALNKKYIPVIKTAVNQMLNIAEQTLIDAQSATFGITLNEKGLSTTVVAEFEPSSYIGKLWSSSKNSTEPLISSLPNRKYFAYGGMVIDPATGTKLFDDIVGPILKEVQTAGGPEMQSVSALADGFKMTIQATNTAAFGYAAPTAPPGQQSIVQQVFIYNGDAKKIQEASAKSWQGMQAIMKMIPQAPGASLNMQMNKGVKTVEGVTLDEMVMDMKLDAANNPEAAQADQMMKMIYGPKGMGGYFGAVNDKAYIAVTGGNDELLTATIKTVKAGQSDLASQAQIKAVSDSLPKSRALVYYIDLGSILNTGLQFAAQMGMAMPLKLPQDMPPVGISAGTEGSAIRIDTHLSTELIENLVSAGMQAAMMMGGQQQRPGQL